MQERHYLTPLFEAASVAIIGASERLGSIGAVLVRTMLDAGYQGRLFAVNPKHERIFDLHSYATVEDIPQRLDLAVIATNAAAVPAIMEACGRAGVRAAIVISAGFSEVGRQGAALERAVLESARRHRIRLVGPNCLGVLRPEIGLNATFARGGASAGSIGLVSQSGALCTAILDWAKPNGVGFSSVISVGGSSEVEFGEFLDYLATDAKTESIFLYIEGIRDARRFMSALRAAARVKPVLVIKVGRHPGGEKAVLSHTGLLVGWDDVFDAALRRAGGVRLYSVGHFFAAAQALFARFRPRGNRLAVVTNGGGPGIMAADRCADLGIPLAQLSEATLNKLNAFLPSTWSHSNPVDIAGDADPVRYKETLKTVLDDEGVDGVLAIFAPQALSDAGEAAQQVIDVAKNSDKPLVTCWMGEDQVRASRDLFKRSGVPTFRTPDPAVELFSHISNFFRNQKLLMQTPAPLSHLGAPSVSSARLVIETALAEKRHTLSEMESKAVLAAFRIPISRAVVARSAAEAMALAAEIGLPVAMKIDSPHISRKSESGGVRLNLNNLQSVRAAYQDILDEVKRNRPEATIHGVAVEPMIVKPNGRELMAGIVRDEVFGPTIALSEGGNNLDVHRHRCVALPPLNSYLVSDMVCSPRFSRLLGEFRAMPPVNLDALELVLLRISEMACELPWLRELEINPLIVDEHGAVAVDAHIVVEDISPTAHRYDHMAIHPYPASLVQTWPLPDGAEVTIRPIRPEDAELQKEFVKALSAQDKYYPFLNTLREITDTVAARLTQIDYDREMALSATVDKEGREVQVGVCRYTANADAESCEFAIVVADQWQRKGLARKLMGVLIETARERGLKYMNGAFLATDERMLQFASGSGFVISDSPDEHSIKHGVLTL
jgi:acetyltransferase